MTITQESLCQAVDAIPGLVEGLHKWRREARGDIPNLSRWGKEAALLSRAVRRKGSLGVYGESQIGKSFLISALAATKGRIEIRTPGGAEPVDFLKTLNHEHGQETTGLVSRFAARQPELLGPEKDALTVELLDLEDLIWCFVLGVQQDVEAPSPDAIEDSRARVQEIIAATKRSLDAATEDDPRIGVMSSVDRVCKRMDDEGGCSKLPRDLRSSYRDVVADYLREGKRPPDAIFFPFVALLWHGHECEALLRLFRRLYDAVHKLQGFDVVEVAMRDVQARGAEQHSLLTVTVVSQIGDAGQPSIKAYGRSGVGGDHGVCTIQRPELAALVSEVMLPVERDPGAAEHDLLSIGDVLDFPGSRAAGKLVPMALLTDKEALNVYLRGKLTRIFKKLVEQQEIGVLCIGVTAKGNVEASKPTQVAIEHWLQQQTSGGLTDPPLLAVFTKCDEMLKPTESHSDGAAQFSSLFRKLDKYNGARYPWLTHWPGYDGEGRPEARARAFSRCICVFNPKFLRPEDAREGLREYLAEAVAAREVRPLCEDASWVNGLASVDAGGAFTGNIPVLRRESAIRLAKVDRREILLRKVRRLLGEIEAFCAANYRAVEITEQVRREEEERADRVAGHLAHASRRSFSKQRLSPFSILLDSLSVTPPLMGRALRRARQQEQGGEVEDFAHAVVQCAFDEWDASSGRLDERSSERIDAFFNDGGEVRTFVQRIPRSEPFRLWLGKSIERLKLSRVRQLGPAATSLSQAWNRLIVDWWLPVRKTEHAAAPTFVPKGDLSRHPSAWMLEHWASGVKDVSREMVDPVGPPPPGNDIVGAVLKSVNGLSEGIRGG